MIAPCAGTFDGATLEWGVSFPSWRLQGIGEEGHEAFGIGYCV